MLTMEAEGEEALRRPDGENLGYPAADIMSHQVRPGYTDTLHKAENDVGLAGEGIVANLRLGGVSTSHQVRDEVGVVLSDEGDNVFPEERVGGDAVEKENRLSFSAGPVEDPQVTHIRKRHRNLQGGKGLFFQLFYDVTLNLVALRGAVKRSLPEVNAAAEKGDS
jgi:hypothetical protein